MPLKRITPNNGPLTSAFVKRSFVAPYLIPQPIVDLLESPVIKKVEVGLSKDCGKVRRRSCHRWTALTPAQLREYFGTVIKGTKDILGLPEIAHLPKKSLQYLSETFLGVKMVSRSTRGNAHGRQDKANKTITTSDWEGVRKDSCRCVSFVTVPDHVST